MTYQAINFSALPQIFSVVSIVLCGLVFALFCYYNYDQKFASVKDKKKVNRVFLILFIITSAGLLSAILNDFIVKYDNRVKASENIVKKYDIQEVNWHDYRSSAYGDGSIKRSSAPNVLVKINGKEHVYRYEVNRDTSEPTLKNITEHAGKQTEPGPPAETLIKK